MAALLSALVRQLPNFAVLVTGIVLVLARRAAFPKAAAHALIGLGLLVLGSAGSSVYFILLPVIHAGGGAAMARAAGGAGLVFGLVHAAGLGFLVAAVLAERPGADVSGSRAPGTR